MKKSKKIEIVPARRFLNFEPFSFWKQIKSPKYLSNLHIEYENDSKGISQILNRIGCEKSRKIEIVPARRFLMMILVLDK